VSCAVRSWNSGSASCGIARRAASVRMAGERRWVLRSPAVGDAPGADIVAVFAAEVVGRVGPDGGVTACLAADAADEAFPAPDAVAGDRIGVMAP
jgi:hypothetical protein